MIQALFSLIAPKVVESVTDVLKTRINRDISETEMRAEVAKAVTAALAGIPESQARVLVAEAQGQSWLQRNWRPLTAASMGFTLFWYGWAGPQFNAWFGLPVGNPGDTILEWTFTGLISFGSVYAGGRTLEKIADKVVSRFGK